MRNKVPYLRHIFVLETIISFFPMISAHQKQTAAWLHFSSFSRFLIPFGNLIVPLLLWSIHKNKSPYIDAHGKQILNFQISVLLYTIALLFIIIPIVALCVVCGLSGITLEGINAHHIFVPSIFVICGFIILSSIFEYGLIAYAGIKANEGMIYKYPLTFQFLK